VFDDVARRPLAVGVGGGEQFQHRADAVVVDRFQGLVRVVFGEIDTGPAAVKRQHAFAVGIAQVVAVFGLRGFIAFTGDHRQQREHLDRIAAAAGGHGAVADVIGDLARLLGGGRADEHPFGVLGGKGAATAGSAGLENHRGALWRRLGQMNARHIVVFALVSDRMDFTRVGENSAFTVAQYRVFIPGAFPQFVGYVQKLIGDVIAFIVGDLLLEAQIDRRAVEVRGHHVPGHATFGQVVEGREFSRQGVRLFVGQRRGHAKAQVLGHGGHGWHLKERIIDRHLIGVEQGGFHRAAIDVIDAHHVGDKDRIEIAALKQFGQVDPVVEVFVFPCLAVRMTPGACGLMAHAGHFERIENNARSHSRLTPVVLVHGARRAVRCWFWG